MYLVAVALCVAVALVDISGALNSAWTPDVIGCLPGLDNDFIDEVPNMEACKELCETTTFTCRSVDFSILRNHCVLSSANIGSYSRDFQTPCPFGDWQYAEKLGEKCTVKGDPHIITYDRHHLIYPPSTGNPITHYETPPRGYDGVYAISQQGKSKSPWFGVFAKFTQCFNDPEGKAHHRTAACVSSVHYTEPGIAVTVILPVKLSTAVHYSPIVLYCQQGRTGQVAADDLDCATQITVNDKKGITTVTGSVSSFRGTDGRVLIIKDEGCNSYKCQIYIVGSKGITVSLLVDPNLKPSPVMYHLNVYSAPSLHNDLFGLCDTFTGELTDTYTPREGVGINNFADLDTGFIKTWTIGDCSCELSVNVVHGSATSGCVITEAAPADKACQCTLVATADGIAKCFGFVVACDQRSEYCRNPRTGYKSCLEGKGNCGGYDE